MNDFVKLKTHPQSILEEIISNNRVVIDSDYSIYMRPLTFNRKITYYEMTFSFVAVKAYRAYYLGEKLCKEGWRWEYKNRNKPEWAEEK